MKKNINTKTNRIDFFDERLYELEDEKGYVYSVNHILNARWKGVAFDRWMKQVGSAADKIANDAAIDGTNVHHLTELLDNDVTVNNIIKDELGRPIPKYNQFVWSNFLRYKYFKEYYGHEVKTLVIEKSFADIELDFGGTIDRVWEFRGLRFILDFKSGGEYPDVEYQLAAYAVAWNKKYPKKKVAGTAVFYTNTSTRTEKDDWEKNGIIRGKGWKLKLLKRDFEESYKTFEHTKAIFDDYEENRGKTSKDRKPKNISIPMIVDPKVNLFKKDEEK